MHKDWPGKIHAPEELQQRKAERPPIWPPIPGRPTGISTADGRPARNLRPAAASAWKRSRAVVAGRSRGPAVLVARDRLRRAGPRRHRIDRPRALVCRPARQRLAAGRFLRPGHLAGQGLQSKSAYRDIQFHGRPTYCASTATTGNRNSPQSSTAGCEAGA